MGDQSGAIHIWDLKTDHNEQLIPEPEVSITSAHIDPDASYMAAVNSTVSPGVGAVGEVSSALSLLSLLFLVGWLIPQMSPRPFPLPYSPAASSWAPALTCPPKSDAISHYLLQPISRFQLLNFSSLPSPSPPDPSFPCLLLSLVSFSPL